MPKIEAGVAYAEELGSDEIRERARRIADGLGNTLVYAVSTRRLRATSPVSRARKASRESSVASILITPSD